MKTTYTRQTGAIENLTLVEAVEGFRVRLHGLYCYSTAGTTINVHGGDGDSLLVAVCGATDDVTLPVADNGWLETGSGEALCVNLTDDAHLTVRYSLTR